MRNYGQTGSEIPDAADAEEERPIPHPGTLASTPAPRGSEGASTPAPHISNNSGEQEWYTPSIYIEAARLVLGAIDNSRATCVSLVVLSALASAIGGPTAGNGACGLFGQGYRPKQFFP